MTPAITTTSALFSTAAFAILAAAGAGLLRRTRSPATAIVAIGFAMALTERLVALVQHLEISALMRAHAADTLYIVHHHALLQYTGLLGLGLAAVGLLWHSARISRR